MQLAGDYGTHDLIGAFTTQDGIQVVRVAELFVIVIEIQGECVALICCGFPHDEMGLQCGIKRVFEAQRKLRGEWCFAPESPTGVEFIEEAPARVKSIVCVHIWLDRCERCVQEFAGDTARQVRMGAVRKLASEGACDDDGERLVLHTLAMEKGCLREFGDEVLEGGGVQGTKCAGV